MNSKTGVRSVTRGRTLAGDGLRLIAILLTHAHVDHVSGVASAKRELKVPTWLHADDQPLYERAAAQGLLFGRWIEQPPAIDHFYAGDGTWAALAITRSAVVVKTALREKEDIVRLASAPAQGSMAPIADTWPQPGHPAALLPAASARHAPPPVSQQLRPATRGGRQDVRCRVEDA
jgi:hypothetical protein